MHELSVTENILKIALEYADKEHASSVTDINIKIGQLSSIIDESVQFYWEIIAKDTICQNAVLNFNRIPARFECLDCSQDFFLGTEPGPCPACGSYNLKIIAGDEFQLDSIVIERESK
jgi:hydrogenase nickel incorporation protein HypA/HybF